MVRPAASKNERKEAQEEGREHEQTQGTAERDAYEASGGDRGGVRVHRCQFYPEVEGSSNTLPAPAVSAMARSGDLAMVCSDDAPRRGRHLDETQTPYAGFVEIILRCAIPDRPGALAELAGVIGASGADIQAVDVIDHVDGVALDDLVVVVESPRHLRDLLDRIAELADVDVVHAAPSRGHPGDAVTRLAMGLQSVLDGSMDPDHGIATLAGGLLRADAVDIVAADAAPAERSGVLVVPAGDRRVVVRRSYAFTATERERALAVIRACHEATRRPASADRAG